MQYLFNKKTFLGFVGILLVISLLAYPGGTNKVVAEGGNNSYIPVVNQAKAKVASADTVYFGQNATWKYYDKGKVPGSGWNLPGFNDGSWAAKSAPLGYGNSIIRTTVSYGSSSSNKYPTTYFRKTFSFSNASSVSALYADLLLDDGAVVFLNGKEVARLNMPSGSVGYSTYSSGCASSGTKPLTVQLNKSALVSGNNTLAVEVHQCSANSSDLIFSLSLHGSTGASAPAPTATKPPATPTSVPTAVPTAIPTTKPTAQPPINVNAVDTVVFGTNATWKYFDKGSLPGSGWNLPGFNDGSWAGKSAPLGYGLSGLRMTVSYGSNASQKYPTTYFRKTFSLSNTSSISALLMDLQLNDGAVIYLNGKEVARPNMPTGSVGYTTLASGCVSSGTTPVTMQIDRSAMVEGNNTLAVEVHQCSANSPDLIFSLLLHELSGTSSPAPTATQPSTSPTNVPTANPTTAPTAKPTSAPTLPPTSGHSYYVTTNGSSSGDGSSAHPWSLAYALKLPGAVHPGDTIWVRGGTYKGAFTMQQHGSSSAWITVRAYPGERATLSNSTGPVLDIYDSYYTNLWGLEITSSYSTRSASRSESTYGIRVYQGAPSHDVKLINLVVHDVQSQGIGYWQALTNSEIYGSLFYFNGTTQLDHGIYLNNLSGTKALVNNFIFDNASHGVHAYTESSTHTLDNIYLEGNTLFNNGSIGYTTTKSQYGIYKRNILLGGTLVAHNPTITNNYTYYPGSSGASMNLGYSAGSSNGKVTNNYFAGGEFDLGGSQSGLAMAGNTVFAPGGLTGFSTSSYSNNSWTSSKPSGTKIFVRPNRYEPNRANLTIYNWAKQSTVSVSASSLGGISLKSGDHYELHNAQNFYSDVVSGTYNGSAITVPMTGHSVAQPVGLSFKPASTFPEFGAFVLIVSSN